jgi:hypothetical protein
MKYPINVKIDGILWIVSSEVTIQPLCPKHHLRMYPVVTEYNHYEYNSQELRCAECKDIYNIPRRFSEEKDYVLDKIDSKEFKGLKFINIDNEAIPLASDSQENRDYFVKSLLTKSKVGLRLVIYAGRKGAKNKTQIFIEPEIMRLAFDQNDLHPTDIFTKLVAQFVDGTSSNIQK